MKHATILALTALLAGASMGQQVHGQLHPLIREQGKGILLVDFGAVGNPALSNLQAFMEMDIQTRVDAKQADPLVPGDDWRRKALTMAGTNWFSLIVFVKQPQNSSLLSVEPDSGIACVNVANLTTTNIPPAALYERILREAMRGFGFSMGEGLSIIPMSVLNPVSTPDDLDTLARNFAPPELSAIQFHAKQRGAMSVMWRRKEWLIRHGLLPPGPGTNAVPVWLPTNMQGRATIPVETRK